MRGTWTPLNQAGAGVWTPPPQYQPRPANYDEHPQRYYQEGADRERRVSPVVSKLERVKYVEVPRDNLVTGLIRHLANLGRK